MEHEGLNRTGIDKHKKLKREKREQVRKEEEWNEESEQRNDERNEERGSKAVSLFHSRQNLRR